MKKILLMTLVVLILQVILPIFTICNNSIFTVTSQANTDYSSVDLDTLEKIKDNKNALIQVKSIMIEEFDKSNTTNVKRKLEFIKMCPNVEYIHICVNSLGLDKTFFEYINSSKDVTLVITCGSVDFRNVVNTNVTRLYLSETKVYNFKDIKNLKKLQWLDIFNVDGFEVADFNEMTNLETLILRGQRINDYKTFFEKLKDVKTLGLVACNLQNSDTKCISKLQQLETLDLFGTYVTDISFLREIQTLQHVKLPLNVDSLDVLYEMPYLQSVSFDSVTELKVTPDLIEYLKNNDISYPLNYDMNINKKVENLLSKLKFSDNTSEEEKVREITRLVRDYMEKDTKYQEEYQTSLDKAINLKYGKVSDYAILEYTLLTMCGIEAYYLERIV